MQKALHLYDRIGSRSMIVLKHANGMFILINFICSFGATIISVIEVV